MLKLVTSILFILENWIRGVLFVYHAVNFNISHALCIEFIKFITNLLHLPFTIKHYYRIYIKPSFSN